MVYRNTLNDNGNLFGGLASQWVLSLRTNVNTFRLKIVLPSQLELSLN